MTTVPTVLPGTLAELFVYNDWATERLLDAASPCPEEALDTPIEMGEGSLRKTLVHLWWAEAIWLQVWQGVDMSWPEGEALTVAQVRQRYRDTMAERYAWLAAQPSCAGNFAWGGTGTDPGPCREMPKNLCILHVLNHGTHHRTQAVNMLKRLGHTLPALDYIRHPDRPTATLDLATLRAYLQHGDWGFWQIHQAAQAFTDADLDREFPLGPGTLRRIMRHLADAPAWWLDSLEHGPGTPFPAIDPCDTWDAAWHRYQQVSRRRLDLVDTLDDAALSRPIRVTPVAGQERTFPLGVALLQLCTHGTHHRAQAANMLRHLGATVPELDVRPWYKAGSPVVV